MATWSDLPTSRATFCRGPRSRRRRLHGRGGGPTVPPSMGSSPNGVLASARHVTIVGHNSRIVPTVGFFVGGGMSVLVYTTQGGLEADLAPSPGVHVTVLSSYEHAPPGLLEPPYVVAVDQDDDALLIRSWLPPTTAVFLARSEQRRRGPLHGFLSLVPSTTHLRPP